MKIAILAAGAAGMYCGSCLRDNAMAVALTRAGHEVSFIPLYTSVRSDGPAPHAEPLFFGGVNTFLAHKVPLFHLVPRALGRLLDSDAVLGLAGRLGGMTSGAELGALAVSVLEGDRGRQARELGRLTEHLAALRPDVVQLPNAFFLGAARPVGERLGVPVVCQLTGEDIFLDAIGEPYRGQVLDLIRRGAAHADAFIASSKYYAERAAKLFSLPPARISVVWTGIDSMDFQSAAGEKSHLPGSPPTVGYFARICPEKGLDILVDAARILHKRHGLAVRVRAAGWLGSHNKPWFDALRQSTAAMATDLSPAACSPGFEYLGEVDRAGKIAFLSSLDVLSVPARYAEAKGIYVLEALAAGVPVVQPAHGCFPELIRDTGGGVLVPPGDTAALADALAALLCDPDGLRTLGDAGRLAVQDRYSADIMGEQLVEVCRRVLEARSKAD